MSPKVAPWHARTPQPVPQLRFRERRARRAERVHKSGAVAQNVPGCEAVARENPSDCATASHSGTPGEKGEARSRKWRRGANSSQMRSRGTREPPNQCHSPTFGSAPHRAPHAYCVPRPPHPFFSPPACVGDRISGHQQSPTTRRARPRVCWYAIIRLPTAPRLKSPTSAPPSSNVKS